MGKEYSAAGTGTGTCFILWFALLLIKTCTSDAMKVRSNYSKAAACRVMFDVRDYGAFGNGLNDDTKAFLTTWEIACKVPFATLYIPRHMRFLVHPSVFRGPCARHFTFQVDGMLLAPELLEKWSDSKVWLEFKHLSNFFSLNGRGAFFGRGSLWWSASCKTINNKRSCLPSPSAVQFQSCNNVKVSGVTFINSPHFHLDFFNCDRIQIHRVRIFAPKFSPNTDGIHIEKSSDVYISNSKIATGDDCISIGKGSSNIEIRNVTCGPGHGIRHVVVTEIQQNIIGSLGRANTEGNVSQVLVDGAKLIATQNGLRIKTWQGGYGRAKNIVFQNVEMINAANPIIIDQFYCDSPYPCPNSTYAVEVSEVTFKGVRGTSATDVAVRIACSDNVPCKHIVLTNISLSLNSGHEPAAVCLNALGSAMGSVVPASCLL